MKLYRVELPGVGPVYFSETTPVCVTPDPRGGIGWCAVSIGGMGASVRLSREDAAALLAGATEWEPPAPSNGTARLGLVK